MKAVNVRYRRRLLPLAVGLLLAWLQTACRKTEGAESAPAEAEKDQQPGLFTVPPEQAAHLKTIAVRATNWPVAVHTTGTVDWGADHARQAIDPANGPISRILVDTGVLVEAGGSRRSEEFA